jgi:hypothetical protein
MYIGAGLALASAALFYESFPLLGYAGLFFLATRLFVVCYEEPSRRRTFAQSMNNRALDESPEEKIRVPDGSREEEWFYETSRVGNGGPCHRRDSGV